MSRDRRRGNRGVLVSLTERETFFSGVAGLLRSPCSMYERARPGIDAAHAIVLPRQVERLGIVVRDKLGNGMKLLLRRDPVEADRLHRHVFAEAVIKNSDPLRIRSWAVRDLPPPTPQAMPMRRAIIPGIADGILRLVRAQPHAQREVRFHSPVILHNEARSSLELSETAFRQ